MTKQPSTFPLLLIKLIHIQQAYFMLTTDDRHNHHVSCALPSNEEPNGWVTQFYASCIYIVSPCQMVFLSNIILLCVCININIEKKEHQCVTLNFSIFNRISSSKVNVETDWCYVPSLHIERHCKFLLDSVSSILLQCNSYTSIHLTYPQFANTIKKIGTNDIIIKIVKFCFRSLFISSRLTCINSMCLP